MTTLQDHMIPRDLVECLRIEADHARNPPTEYLVADDGGRMVHKPKPDLDMAELLDQAANRIAAEGAINDGLRKALHEIYWEAMNLGTTHKWLASNDGEIDEYSPSYTVSQVVHEFARKVIKPAAQAHGVELYK